MKINKQLCLDPAIAELLKEEKNASELVNKLLEGHFALENSENLALLYKKKKELESLFKKAQVDLTEIIKKINKIEEKTRHLCFFCGSKGYKSYKNTMMCRSCLISGGLQNV